MKSSFIRECTCFTCQELPLGLALTGSKVGEKVTYTLPNGSSMTVELLSAEPYAG